MSYNDLRKGRYSGKNHVYFVTTVISYRRQLFRDLIINREVICCMKELHETGMLNSIAWVVMPDHVHWLFSLEDGIELGQVIKIFKGRSARILNQCLGLSGKFWQKAYYDHAIRKDEDIKSIARYIVANPLRAGLVERIEDYPHWDAIWL